MSSAPAKRVLLVIGGGISAYKVLEAIRRLRERGVLVRCILTKAGAEFVTPLTVGTLSAERVFGELFDLTDEHDVGHIKLARDCDLVVVAPATADLIAKMALGLANDLASTALLATDRPILIVPAMNPTMWAHPATQANVGTLKARGVAVLGPAMGAMAERGESGLGRMVEPPEIVDAVMARLAPQPGPLKGRHVLVTSGPTREPIDPVRYIANHSSGKQGHAIAAAAAAAGARVTLVAGPVRLADPARRRRRAHRDRPRHAGRLRGGAAGGCRGVRRRGGRLARRPRCRPEDQEDRRRPAGFGAGREPRHPRHHRAGGRAAAARHRLRRRDRARARPCQGQARAKRLRPGSSPTTSRPNPA